MADQTFRHPNQMGSVSQQRSEDSASATQNLADQARSAGRDLKDKAAQVVESSSEAIKSSSEAVKERASDLADAAKDAASQMLKQTVEGQKNVGADYVGNLAETMRRAAREFDNDLPFAGTYIRKAASQVEDVAEKIRAGNLSDLVQGAQSFARRQPTAFLGMAVLAGFGAVRFFKSSSQPTSYSQPGGGQSRDYSQSAGGGYSRPDAGADGLSGSTVSHMENQGYRDEARR